VLKAQKPIPVTDANSNNLNYSQEFERLVAIVSRLRKDCPWDREQTHASIAPHLIEEAYEVVETIDKGDKRELGKELGDILLHVVFHANLAEETGEFSLAEVIRQENEKLIYRHPHVFGEAEVATSAEVKENWEQLKRKEAGRTSIIDGVPKAMPALQRASRIQDKAAKVGFDWHDPRDVLAKITEEAEEFLAEHEEEKKIDEFGDLLFALVNYSRHIGIDAESALRKATDKFDMRFRKLEVEVEKGNKQWNEYTLEELDSIWKKVKRNYSL
jgi:MazG family protein